jgi:putative flavoprotein involved in K+ transport
MLSEALPEFVKQHTSRGFDDSTLGSGAVLVVGSGQSGCQIAHLLTKPDAAVTRKVYLCVGKTGGCCRNYKGEDLFFWLQRMKFLQMPKEAFLDMPPLQAEAVRYAPPPVTGPYHALSPFSLHRQGVNLLGRLKSVEGPKLGITDHAANLQHILAGVGRLNGMVNAFIQKWTKDNDGEDWEPADAPEWTLRDDEAHLVEDQGPAEVDLQEAGVTDVLWATGYSFDLSYLLDGVPQVAEELEPKHGYPTELISKVVPGLFFTGFPWLTHIQSQNLVGMDADHAKILEHLR